MFNPMIPAVPKPWAYLDQLKTYYAAQTKPPSMTPATWSASQNSNAPKPFSPQIPALPPLQPLQPLTPYAQGSNPNAPKPFTPKPPTMTESGLQGGTLQFPTPTTPPGQPPLTPPTGGVTATQQNAPLTDTYSDGTLTATAQGNSLADKRIANTLRQVPENLRETWETLGAEWHNQFSTWQQSYVNDFLTRYAAGDFDAANAVAQSWYDKKDAYAKRNGSREQQQADQDYWDSQSQYRQSGYIG